MHCMRLHVLTSVSVCSLLKMQRAMFALTVAAAACAAVPGHALLLRQPGPTMMPPQTELKDEVRLAPLMQGAPRAFTTGPEPPTIAKPLPQIPNSVVLNRVANELEGLKASPPGIRGGLATGEVQGGDGDNGLNVWLRECLLIDKDLQFWGLGKSDYRAWGVGLPNTTAFTDSCEACTRRKLPCNPKEVPLAKGNCICAHRVWGFDPIIAPVDCSNCVEDCIGTFKVFDVGSPNVPAQQTGGICLRNSGDPVPTNWPAC